MSRLFAREVSRLRASVAGLLLGLPLLAAADDTDRIIVKYRSAPVAAAAQAAQLRATELPAQRLGVVMSRQRTTALGSQVLKVNRKLSLAEAEALARDIAASDPDVEYAEPDRRMYAAMTPNDPRYNEQWHYKAPTAGINVESAWDKATGAGVVVGVLDTGYRPHADLAANILAGYDFISDTFTANDGGGRDGDALDPGTWINPGECGHAWTAPLERSSWHGTHVAGTIAALTNNSNGVAGVAFNSKIVPARVLGKCGGFTSDIADAIIWVSGGAVPGVPANANPARVLNVSLGRSGSCDSTTQSAINSALSRGASVIVAAGNDNIDAANFSPASCSGVVTVASVDVTGGKAYNSNYGSLVEIAAPGGDVRVSAANGVLSTLNSGVTTPGIDTYEFYQGTSMAAPHVAGVVALMLQANPTLTPAQVTTILQSTARPFPATCSQCGAGIVNANAAVDAALGTPATPPAAPASISVPSSSSTGSYTISWSAVTGTVTRYELFESGNASFAPEINIYGNSATSLPVTGRAAGTWYYRVRACNGAGCSSHTPGANGVTVTTPPLPAITISSSSGTILITNPGGATARYGLTPAGDIYKSTSQSNQFVDVGDWMTPKTPSAAAQFKVTISNLGTNPCTNGPMSGTFNLGNAIEWSHTIIGARGMTSNCKIGLEIRDVATNTLRDSAQILFYVVGM